MAAMRKMRERLGSAIDRSSAGALPLGTTVAASAEPKNDAHKGANAAQRSERAPSALGPTCSPNAPGGYCEYLHTHYDVYVGGGC